jgi:hypothetical protein
MLPRRTLKPLSPAAKFRKEGIQTLKALRDIEKRPKHMVADHAREIRRIHSALAISKAQRTKKQSN